MTQLLEALHALGLEGEVDLSGRWVKIPGERCSVYVLEAPWATGYYTWCDSPGDRTVEYYPGPAEAVRVGLRRAGVRGTAAEATNEPPVEGGGERLGTAG